MPKKANTDGASAPSKSKTARSKTAKAKSKDKAAPRKEARKAASEAARSAPLLLPNKEGARDAVARAPRRPTIGRTLGSPIGTTVLGSESPVFDIPMITGSESDGDSPGSTKDPTPSQDAPSQDTPAQDAPTQDAPIDDAKSSEAKAASTSSPAKNLTLATEGAAPGPPTSEPSIAKGFKSLFDSSDEEEEEGLSPSPTRSR
ncbi:Hypothetical protein PHPALM_16181 [Phytophthora palmivora]|uniref:ABC Superfamily n=1 Tax=Phytophthora palmivora TaxID=4796 RepID=A0A2P4XQF4_9STRA|nr:Hypothetical protein PHPALM_16181 [Phytophthora palmivora]